MRWCAVSSLGSLALAGCTGNPIEAIVPGGDEESTSSRDDAEPTGTTPDGDSGATMVPQGSTGSDATSAADSSGDPGNDTTGSSPACGDTVAQAGEWCWFDPLVIDGVTGVGALAIGSLDSDGDLEIVVTDSVDAPLLVESGGAGWTVLAISALPHGLDALVAGDLDGDGFDDVVGTNGAYAMSTALGGATGLRTGQTLTTYGSSGLIALFDGDTDGDLDVAYAWATSSEVDFYENDLGTLAYWTFAYGASTSHVDLDVADVDNDGFRDVIAMGLPGAFDVYRATAATVPTPEGNDVSDGTSMLGAGDLDGDGWVDVARLMPEGDALALFRGHTDGWESPVVLPVSVDLTDLDLADLDGDDDLDIVVAGGAELVMFENLGKADLAPRDAIPLGLSAARVDVADLDGNGRVELVLRGEGGLEILVANP